AVGDVGAETPLLHLDGLSAQRILTELPQRWLRCAAALALLRLREQRERLLERDLEQLLLALQRAGLLSFLDVRPEPAAPREDFLAVVRLPEHARQGQALQRLLQRDRPGRHVLEERPGPGLLRHV